MNPDYCQRFANLAEAIHQNCLDRADAKAFTFVVDGDEQEIHLTYAELDEKGRAIAARLQQCTRPGDRAVLLFPPGLDSLPAFVGCMYAGMVIVPVIPPRPNQALTDFLSVIDETTPGVILTTNSLEPFARKLKTSVPGLEIIATDRGDSRTTPEWQPPDSNLDSLAILHFTSGSTKKPRGICFSHGNILRMIDNSIEKMNELGIAITDDASGVSWLPYYTGLGLIGSLVPLLFGRHAVLMSPLDFSTKPVRWLRLMSRYRSAGGGGPNFGFQLVVDRVSQEECEGLDLSNWQIVYCASEPIRPALLKAFAEKLAPYGFKATFSTGYGLSESMLAGASHIGPISSITVDRKALQQNKVVVVDPGQSEAYTLCSVGEPTSGITLRIINPETLEDCAPDEIGELWLKGPNFPSGYYNQPDETRAVFHNFLPDGSGPFLRTGDLGFLSNGELYIAGRLKDLIIIHGRNYWAQDIEQVAEKAHSHLQAGSSAAFGVSAESDHEAEQLVIALELKPGVTNPDSAEIAHKVRLAVAEEFQLPVHSVVLVAPNSIPRTSSGKVQRYQARLSYLSQQ